MKILYIYIYTIFVTYILKYVYYIVYVFKNVMLYVTRIKKMCLDSISSPKKFFSFVFVFVIIKNYVHKNIDLYMYHKNVIIKYQ